MAHASNAHGTQITEYDLKLLTGADLLDVPHPVAPQAASFRETALHQLTARAGMEGEREMIQQRSGSLSCHDTLLFHGPRKYSPASLSSRSSHDSEDDNF